MIALFANYKKKKKNYKATTHLCVRLKRNGIIIIEILNSCGTSFCALHPLLIRLAAFWSCFC